MEEFVSSKKGLYLMPDVWLRVNVPSVDMVSFTHQKEVDIVQAIGRARNRDQKNLDMSLFQYLSKKIKMKLSNKL